VTSHLRKAKSVDFVSSDYWKKRKHPNKQLKNMKEPTYSAQSSDASQLNIHPKAGMQKPSLSSNIKGFTTKRANRHNVSKRLIFIGFLLFMAYF